MKNSLKIFVITLLFFASISALTLNVKTSLPDITSRQYFCNPCWITWSNETDTAVERVPMGASNVSFTAAQNSVYSFIPAAELLGFNKTGDAVGAAGNETAVTLRVPISAKGYVAYVGAPTGAQWYDGTDYGWMVQNWERKAYSYQLLKNITMSLGYGTPNIYNGGGNYSITGSYASNSFINYEAVVVGHASMDSPMSDVMSSTLLTALQTAKAAGTIVYVPSLLLWKSSSAGAGTSNYSGSGSGSPYEPTSTAGLVQNGTNYYPLGHDLASSMYPIFTQHESVSGSLSVWYATTGTPSYIYVKSVVDACTSGTCSGTAPMYRIVSGWRVLPTYRHYGYYGSKITFTPALFALMYNALDDYGTDIVSSTNSITINAYEGTDQCSIIKPLDNVMCCFNGACGSTSGLTSNAVRYSTGIASASNPETENRSDTTEEMVFWNSQRDFEEYVNYHSQDTSHVSNYGPFNLANWQDYYEQNMAGNPESKAWMAYSDPDIRRTRLSYIASKGSADGETHVYMGYDFYDVPRDIGALSNMSFTMTYNASPLDYDADCLCVPFVGCSCSRVLHTCEAGDYWNISIAQGRNTSDFRGHWGQCVNGVFSQWDYTPEYADGKLSIYTHSGFTEFDADDFSWYYGNAPNFPKFAYEQLSSGDVRPLAEILYNLEKNCQGASCSLPYRWLRQFTLAVFETKYEQGTGPNTDTGAAMDIKNQQMHYNYDKYAGGSTSITGGGSGQLECYAPDGYMFRQNDGNYTPTWARNITVNAPVSIGVKLERVRPLNMRLHVYSKSLGNVENAKCSLQGYSDSWSTNGMCYFNGIEPNKIYNLTITQAVSGTEPINQKIQISDYYNSADADHSHRTCSLFDGNYSFNISTDAGYINIIGHVRTLKDNRWWNVTNALVDIDGTQQSTALDGTFTMLDMRIKQGYPYAVTITKKPYILDFVRDVYNFDCDKDNNCFVDFVVQANASYVGNVNDDTDIQKSGDLGSILDFGNLVVSILKSPLFLSFIFAMALGAIGFAVMEVFGAVVGFAGGIAIATSVSLLAPQYLLYITLLMVAGVVISALLAMKN